MPLSSEECRVETCGNPVLALGLCNGHYLQSRNNKALSPTIKIRRAVCSKCKAKHYGLGFCQKHYTQHLRETRLDSLIQEAGGKCADCQTSYHRAVYDFHHNTPADKEYAIGNEIVNRPLEELRVEAAKCTLLCANCHRIRHAGK